MLKWYLAMGVLAFICGGYALMCVGVINENKQRETHNDNFTA